MSYPEDLRYDEQYSWVRKEEDDTYSVGITKATADEGEFVFVQLPETGTTLTKGDVYVTMESVKTTGTVTSPLSGEIIAVNEAVYDDPALINQDPYGSWIIRIKATTPEYDELLTAAQRSNT